MTGRPRTVGARDPATAVVAAVVVAAGLLAGPVMAQVPESRVLFDLPAGLSEVSGAAYGKNGLLYVHEDSGSDPVVTSLDPVTGSVVGRHDLGVDARDWEDIAEGPDGLYVADIGDNSSRRDRGVLVHVLPDPTTTQAPPARSVRLTYEDGPRDAEALLVHPRTGQVVVVTKFAGLVFVAPQPFGPGVLTRVGQVKVGFTGTSGGPERAGPAAQVLITAGDVSPDGRRVVIRTYTDAYVYEVPGDDLVAALATEPTVLPLPASRQGEAIAWSPDGTSLVTVSEGEGAPVFQTPAPPFVEPTEPTRLPGEAEGPAGRDAAGPSASLLLAGGAAVGALVIGLIVAFRPRGRGGRG